MSFMNKLSKRVKSPFASAQEHSAELSGTVDTGCLPLNALLSGSLYGGVQNNKITAIAGDPATGKTFFALSIAKHFLNSHPEAGVMYVDTEAAITSNMLNERGIDSDRMIINESSTIQEFRKNCLDALDEYEKEYGKTPKDERPPFMIILDSLGMLSSVKEVEDSVKGNDTRDMTKAQLFRSVFRVLTLKMAKLNVPMIVTVHTYDTMSQYVPKEMSGGSGLKFAASTILFLSKSKDRDGDKEIIGNIIRVRAHKSRFTKENSEVELRLSFTTGLDKYYGLLDLALKYGIFQKQPKQIEVTDGTKVYESAIWKNPEKYFTEDVMKKLEEAAAKEFLYGSGE